MAKIVTITNPLTGQPAQVDQLDHTAQQIDDGLNIARGVSNPNLLDNWYFGNPVDQRQGYVVPPGVAFYASDDTTLSTPLGTTAAYDTVVERNSTYAKFVNASGAYYLVAASDAVRGYTGRAYTIDRWMSYKTDNAIIITENGLQLINTSTSSYIEFVQRVLAQQLTGKTVTASFLTASNEFVTGSATVSHGMTVNICSGSKIRLTLV